MGALYYGDTIQAPIIASLNYLKSNYHNSIEFIENEINKHTFQAQKNCTPRKESEKV